MVRQTPAGMRSEVRKEAIRLLNALRIDGWQLSAVQWENQSERIVGVTAESPDNKTVLVSCREDRLIAKLEDLLSSR